MDKNEVPEELLELGGSIQLAGFHNIDKAELIVVKKLAGTYARKFADRFPNFQNLRLLLKTIHKREKSEEYELTGKLFINGKPLVATDTNRNLYFSMDIVLKQLEKDAIREHEKKR
jgi:ribosome-associated translation inhibitor RaiA